MRPEHPVVPDYWTPRGEAVAERGFPKPLVVWGGIPGEPALVHVHHRGQNRWFARVLEAPEPHRYRVEPPCDRYELCGGCPFMHLDPTGQDKARRALVGDALDEAGLGDVELGDFHASPDGHEDFRHVIKVGFGYSDHGRIRVGAWGRRDRRIVPIPKCNVAVPALRHTMMTLAHFTIEREIRPWNSRTGQGVLRAAVLRASRTTGQVLITLVAARRISLLRDLADDIASTVSGVAGVWLHLNDDPGNALFERDERGEIGVVPLLGKATLTETIGGIGYSIGPGDFFQTNPAMAEVLYARTLDRLQLGPGVPVVDLYSGVGGIALQAAQRTGWALGIEEVEGAVTRARDTARRHGIAAEFVGGRVVDALPDVGRRLEGKHPVVTVDPARRGLEDGVIDAILALEPSRIGYVSCNPRALARDLAQFRAAGWTIGPVELFDMFPNTPHVECLVVLDGPHSDKPRGRAPRRKIVRGTSG